MAAIDVSRYVDRKILDLKVKVLTPMFLGGADGDAELRAAPFKAALRYWWRITQGDISHEELRMKEQKLFGGILSNKETDEKPTKSQVAVVVTGFVKTGNVDEQDSIGKKVNPEANNKNVPLSAYLGMGPVHFNGKYTKKRILPEEQFNLSITFPKAASAMVDALSLIKEFGTIGARSRNGWGSFELKVLNDSISLLSRQMLFNKYGKEINSIFSTNKKYPFCLGITNSTPLSWKIGDTVKWQDAMKLAGESYMDLRQQVLPFPASGIQKRHILGYPITNHILNNWGGKNGRMPSQLRIIIRKNEKGFSAYFFHLPHKIPKSWDTSLGTELNVWQSIHSYLDTNFTRAI